MNYLKFSGLAVLAFSLAACAAPPAESPSVEKGPTVQQVSEKNIISQYDIPNFTVTEFSSISDPARVCVAIDGTEAVGISCWKQDAVQPGQPRVIAAYSNREGEVVEFVPAANSQVTCFAIDSTSSGALHCAPN